MVQIQTIINCIYKLVKDKREDGVKATYNFTQVLKRFCSCLSQKGFKERKYI